MLTWITLLFFIGMINCDQTNLHQQKSTIFQTSFLSKSKELFLIDQSSNVTVVFITCCQRYQLLKNALMNFSKNSDYPVRQIIVANDGAMTKKLIQALMEVPPLTLLNTNQKVGQIITIDRAYELVKTPYVYFSEDDMIMVMKGVIGMNVKMLQQDPKILQVRNSFGFNTEYPRKGKYIDPQYPSSGFSFHPTVNRMDVYRQLQNGYAGLTHNCSYGTGAGIAQSYINDYYRSKKWLCVQSLWQSIRHGGHNLGNPRYLPWLAQCENNFSLDKFKNILIFLFGAILGATVGICLYRSKNGYSKQIQNQQNQQQQSSQMKFVMQTRK